VNLFKNKGLELGWGYLWEHKKKVLRIFLISMAGAALGAIVPLIFGKMVRDATDPKTLISLLVAMCIVWIFFDQFYNWTTRYSDKNGAHVGWDASGKLFVKNMQHFIKLPMSFLADQRLGKIVQRLDRSVEYLERDIRDVVFSSVPHFISAVICLSVSIYLNLLLGLLLLGTVILYIFAMRSKTKLILAKAREVRKMWEECWGYMWDIINNIKTIKGNTTEEFEMERIERAYSAPYKKEKEIEEIRTELKMRGHVIFGLGAVLTLSLGVWLLRIGAIDSGILISFSFYLNLVYKPFGQLSHNWRLVQESTVALERTAKFEELTEEDYESGNDYEMIGRIEFKDVSFAYKGDPEDENRHVFKNLNFTVNPGETVALVGKSGVGKTTLADLISRYYEPESGSILIDGKDIRTWNLKSLRSQIALVPQDVNLFNDSVRLNIAYGNLSILHDNSAIEEASSDAYAHEFITGPKFKGGYDQVVGERGVKVSTGQRQRIAIARAFARNKNTRILILDEVTSALDSESEKHIQEALHNLKQGKTTFIIAHRLSTIKNSDKIIVMDKDGIAEIGSHTELMKNNGSYKKFVDLQSLSTNA